MREGDTLVVPKLGRLARFVPDACTRGKLHGKQPKLSVGQQWGFCRMHAIGTSSASDLAKLFSFSRSTVYRPLNRRHSPQCTILPSTGIDPMWSTLMIMTISSMAMSISSRRDQQQLELPSLLVGDFVSLSSCRCRSPRATPATGGRGSGQRQRLPGPLPALPAGDPA